MNFSSFPGQEWELYKNETFNSDLRNHYDEDKGNVAKGRLDEENSSSAQTF